MVKNPPAKAGDALGQEDPLETDMATHSSILVWEVPFTEEPGGVQSRGSQRDGHNLVSNQQILTAVWRLDSG